MQQHHKGSQALFHPVQFDAVNANLMVSNAVDGNCHDESIPRNTAYYKDQPTNQCSTAR
jgi:hypothetical protein